MIDSSVVEKEGPPLAFKGGLLITLSLIDDLIEISILFV